MGGGIGWLYSVVVRGLAEGTSLYTVGCDLSLYPGEYSPAVRSTGLVGA